MTEMARERCGEGKRRAPEGRSDREEAGQQGAGGKDPQWRKGKKDRIRERATDRNTERQRKSMERHREMESPAGCCADRGEQGETQPPPRPGGEDGQGAHPDRRTDLGRGRAGSGRGRWPQISGGARKGGAGRAARRGRKRRCRAGAGRGARAGSGEGRRGGGLRKNAPTSCPARARKREPGHRARDRRARPRAPRRSPPSRTPGTPSVAPPGLLPSAARGSGRRREGSGALQAVESPPPGTPEPEAALPWASVFPSVKGAKRRELILAECPGEGR